jgi:ribosomal protein S18 acetylase RimI-like enzyme
MLIRNLREADYTPIIAVLDSWWGGRHMSDMLPRLFFVHFQDTSFIAEEETVPLGFLVGFISQTHPTHAYIHFVGVHPEHRQKRIGDQLYQQFFDTVKAGGCDTVHCVTSPINKGSIAFHTRMGFQAEQGETSLDGVPIKVAYDGEGEDRVVFVKKI